MAIEKEQRFDPHGPAVQLAIYDSIFPLHLAEVWQKKGIDVRIVSREAPRDELLANRTKIVSVRQYYGAVFTRISKNYKIFFPLEKLVAQIFSFSYRRRTGQRELHPGEIRFVGHLIEAAPTARIVRSLKPRFVFAHDVAFYGLAAAFCKGIPKILFPWGGEIFMGAETSPILYHLIRYSLNAADLIVPASETAAEHIRNRFRIPPEKVHAISWGVDRNLFNKATDERKRKLCERFGINPGRTIITNPRRFRPTWGCFIALKAFMRLAAEDPNLHFIMLGGQGTGEYIKEAKAQLEAQNIADRFTLIGGDVALQEFAEIMGSSEIFVSLLGLGDMRSASVLQGVAAGAVPVISDNPEYRLIAKKGFDAVFVNPNDAEDVYRATKLLLQSPQRLAQIRCNNYDYVASYEDSEVQMEKLLKLIADVSPQ